MLRPTTIRRSSLTLHGIPTVQQLPAVESWQATARPAARHGSRRKIGSQQYFRCRCRRRRATQAYTAADGYWVKKWFPIETGCIKIDYQTEGRALHWVDVTQEILKSRLGRAEISIRVSKAHDEPHPLRSVTLPGGQVNASGPTINGGVTVAGCGPTRARMPSFVWHECATIRRRR